jgi:ketosteroid isomerase-like protein
MPDEHEALMALSDRLDRLEDERAILRTLYTYGHAIDYGLEDEFVDCWVPDGILVWPPPHPSIIGHEALRAAFRRHTHAPELFHKHIIAEPLIESDGDLAEASTMFMRLDGYPGGPQISAYGRYVDALVRSTDRRWRFVSRRAELEAWRPGRVDSRTLSGDESAGGTAP